MQTGTVTPWTEKAAFKFGGDPGKAMEPLAASNPAVETLFARGQGKKSARH